MMMKDQHYGVVESTVRDRMKIESLIRWWLPLAPAFITAIISGCWDYRTPGIYMDAVNPDYMVVKAINNIPSLYGWYLPGSLIFGIFPTLVQIYHGALPFYVGLPFFALFGTGLIGIRIVNTIFALLVLCSTFVLLRTLRVRSIIIVAVLTCLALDPAFIFSFRTQFYITVLPISLVMISISFNTASRADRGPCWYLFSGFASGLSVYGYFIYLFFAPTLIIHAVCRSHAKLRPILAWLIGFGIGCLPYIIGYALILRAVGGVAQFKEFISHSLATLDVTPSSMGVITSVIYVKDMVIGTLLDFGPSLIMTHDYPATSLPHFKIIALLILPAIYLFFSVFRGKGIEIFVVFGLIVGNGVLFFIFGKRVWLHHAMPLLPIFYVGLALTVEGFLFCLRWERICAMGGALLACSVLSLLLAANLLDRHTMFVRLERTGGVGLASDAIVRFAEDNSEQTLPTQAFFPDWGIFMSFEMITNGMTPVRTDFTPSMAVKALCAGDDVLLGTIEGKSTSQIDGWKAAIGWNEPTVKVYAQRDGTPVMTTVRWSSHVAQHAPCP